MKNKIKFKKYILTTWLVTLILSLIFLGLNIYEYHKYTINFNNTIASIISTIKKHYPRISDNEILQIINSEYLPDNTFFSKYGIDLEKEAIVLKNQKLYHSFLVINISFLLVSILIVFWLFLKYNCQKERDIKDITKYIEEINHQNYELKINTLDEDELSILKNEIYKTTVMLKEAALNSNQDKLNLKSSLEDISHQLKTPLTSILIMLDDLIDDEEMTREVQIDFLHDIKREVMQMNFLVQSLLKLSKFDANTIDFIRKKVLVTKIINETLKNVSALCDLKNISIQVMNQEKVTLVVDAKWQIEALTNILKNCIEHSITHKSIKISYSQNQVYTLIKIEDEAGGISDTDLPHIFERFYQGTNSSEENAGIGLALAKTIIEKDNGSVQVSSNNNGTTFTIKYYF